MDASLPAVTVTSGQAIFFDGVTSVRRTVMIELGLAAMEIRAPDGEALAAWRYGELASYSAPDGMLRVGPATSAARVEIRDGDLAAAFTARAGRVQQLGPVDPRTRRKVVGFSLAAVASAVLAAMFAVPATVERMAPLVPLAVEQRLGAGADAAFRATLARDHGERFECGQGPDGEASRAALDKLVSRLEAAAELPLPVRVTAVRRAEDNATALGGGHIYVYAGAIHSVTTPDELAAVIAHEMGHVAHRDGSRRVIYSAGLWLLFGPLIGDFSGGAAGWVAMHTVLLPSYSREREAEADAFGSELMLKLGRDPRALANYLLRHGVGSGSTVEILLRDHPERLARAAAIEAIARAAPNGGGNVASALLTTAEWAALKRICQAPKSTPHTPKAEPAPSHDAPIAE
jgi:Zn-dependent protease with chaperone function